MTPPKQQPTNAELLKEIREIKSLQASQDKRLGVLEIKSIQEDAYRAALAKLKDEDEKNKYTGLRDKELKGRADLWKQATIVLMLIAAILYAYASIRGIKT